MRLGSATRTDGKIELISDSFQERELFWISDLKKNPAAPWSDYVKGVLEQLRKRGVNFYGFNAAIAGDIPMGAGMSSSAALEVATALTVRLLFPFSLSDTGATVPPKRSSKGKLPASWLENGHCKMTIIANLGSTCSKAMKARAIS